MKLKVNKYKGDQIDEAKERKGETRAPEATNTSHKKRAPCCRRERRVIRDKYGQWRTRTKRGSKNADGSGID
jgi:hypothetical protein